jgi:peptidoglycan/LPS O-acetylase OafA/YrhL
MSTPSSPQILSLNAVRGLAALLVVVSHLPEAVNMHFGPTHEGSLGVMIFFTLSGFLMGLLYLGKPATPHNMAAYAIARFSRIAPPYLIVVLVSFLVFTLVDSRFPYAIGTHNLLRHALFSGNVSVFWSIPPEVQFYVLFIGIWWAVHRASQGRTGALIAVMSLTVLAICVRNWVPGTFAISKLHYFLMGTLLGGLHGWMRSLQVSTRALTLLQALLLAALVLFMLEVIALPDKYWPDLSPALISGLVVFAFAHDRTVIDKVLAARPFQWFGDWSFSIYLLHVPAIYALKRMGVMQGWLGWVGVVVSVAACAVFSVLIERPACNSSKRRLMALLQRIEKLRAVPVPAFSTEIATDIATDRRP